MFFFRKKTLTLDCFTASASAMKFAQPCKAGNFVPHWWRNLKDGDEIASTMKNCVGFTQLYASSIVLPFWSDIDLSINETGVNWRFYDQETFAEVSPAAQRGAYLPHDDFLQLKIVSPWFFKEKTGINFHVTGSLWNMSNPFEYMVTPGVVNFKHQFSTNLNLLFKRQQEAKNYNFELGDVGLLFVPMTERRVVIKTHLVSEQEIKQFHKIAPVRRRAYFVNKSVESGCPFHRPTV